MKMNVQNERGEWKYKNVPSLWITCVTGRRMPEASFKKLIMEAFGQRKDLVIIPTFKGAEELTPREIYALSLDGFSDVRIRERPALISKNGAFVGRTEIKAELESLREASMRAKRK